MAYHIQENIASVNMILNSLNTTSLARQQCPGLGQLGYCMSGPIQWLVLGCMTILTCYSHPDQLSLAIPSWLRTCNEYKRKSQPVVYLLIGSTA